MTLTCVITQNPSENFPFLKFKLILGGNKIKQMNGNLFEPTKSLSTAWLKNNECIDKVFDVKKIGIPKLSQLVSAKCAFCEDTNLVERKLCEISNQIQELAGKNFPKLLEAQKRQTKLSETFMNGTALENENCQADLAEKISENAQSFITISVLEEKLNAAENHFEFVTQAYETKLITSEEAKIHAEAHVELLKVVYDKLDAQRVENFEIETKLLRSTIELKGLEIEKLKENLTRKTVEINQKNIKIESLESFESIESNEKMSNCREPPLMPLMNNLPSVKIIN